MVHRSMNGDDFFSITLFVFGLEIKNSKATPWSVIVAATRFFLDRASCHKSWITIRNNIRKVKVISFYVVEYHSWLCSKQSVSCQHCLMASPFSQMRTSCSSEHCELVIASGECSPTILPVQSTTSVWLLLHLWAPIWIACCRKVTSLSGYSGSLNHFFQII